MSPTLSIGTPLELSEDQLLILKRSLELAAIEYEREASAIMRERNLPPEVRQHSADSFRNQAAIARDLAKRVWAAQWVKLGPTRECV